MLPKKMQSGELDQQDNTLQRPSIGAFSYKSNRPRKAISEQARTALSAFAQTAQPNPTLRASQMSVNKQPASDQPIPGSSAQDDLITVGEIVGAHGVSGHIKVLPYAQQGQSALLRVDHWQIVRDGETRIVNVLQVRAHNRDTLVAEIQECTQREEAEALRGWKIEIRRAQFPKLKQGEYYWVDLIGLTAVNLQGVVLGTVVGLLENSAHAVLRIAPVTNANAIQQESPPESRALTDKNRKKPSKADKAAKRAQAEILIPFVKAYIGDICWTARTIQIDWQGEEEV